MRNIFLLEKECTRVMHSDIQNLLLGAAFGCLCVAGYVFLIMKPADRQRLFSNDGGEVVDRVAAALRPDHDGQVTSIAGYRTEDRALHESQMLMTARPSSAGFIAPELQHIPPSQKAYLRT